MPKLLEFSNIVNYVSKNKSLSEKNESLKEPTLINEIGCYELDLISLIDLKQGQQGKISYIRGNHKVIRRLLEMGLTLGIIFSLIKIAPFNGPVEIEVRGSRLALGNSVAKNVYIKKL
ncbi:MAG: hypothetical protein HeimC3_41720 [Candidatus Heimdallarchaeota archaeon LC_3]|nr:MAG: hypothetical protein HeimC3_41720 [Candidatus Heimdallarchaeota archaeon LC_3]